MIPRVGSDGSFQSTSSQPAGPQQQRAPVLVVTPHDASGGGRGRPSSLSGSGQQPQHPTTISVALASPATVPLPPHNRRRPRFFPLFGPMRYVQRITATAPPTLPVASGPAPAETGAADGARQEQGQYDETNVATTTAAVDTATEARRATLVAGKSNATSFSMSVKKQEQQHRHWVLRLSLACILLYIGLGVGVYGFGLEKWGAIKAAYFSMVTLTTIGFGDLAPSSEAGKGFTIVFALLGVSLVALSVGEISAYLIEKHDEQVEVFNRALAAKAASTIGNSKTKGIQKALAWELSPLALVLVKAVLPVLVVNVAGAGAIGYMEGWTALDSIYYTVITSTTIGYGDLHPTHTRTYLVAVFYCPFAVCAIGNAISQIAGYYMDKKEAARRQEVLNRRFQFEELFEMDANGDDTIDKHEFTVFLLRMWKIVDDATLAAIHQRFQELDRDGSGTLTREDFLQLLHNNKENDNGANGGTTTASTIISGGDGEGSAEGVVSRVPSSVSFASAGAGAGVDLEGGELEVAVAVEK